MRTELVRVLPEGAHDEDNPVLLKKCFYCGNQDEGSFESLGVILISLNNFENRLQKLHVQESQSEEPAKKFKYWHH